MNDRTKWLALAAVGVFGLYFADSFYRSWIEEPQQRLSGQLDALTTKLREAKDAQMVAKKVGKQLEPYANRALPYDPQLARSLYQEWLLDLVDRHDFESTTVDAGQPAAIQIRSRTKKSSRKTIGHRISYSVRGQATLSKLTDLLYEFRAAGHLHKILSISLNPLGTEGQLDVNLTIEVLSLQESPRKDQLSDWKLVSDATVPRDEYERFVQRNLFARGFARALYGVQLKAITVNRSGVSEAWFTTGRDAETHRVTQGKNVPVPLHDIQVVEVQPDRVMLSVNGSQVWLTLGKTVGEVLGSSADETADS